jgi:aerobic-type carbon monoxide dehydrogenase small subunit (CoxS/CutS family)
MVTFTVNCNSESMDVLDEMPLLCVLRDILDLTGTKYGCGVGACGACTAHVNGLAEYACLTPIPAVAGKVVTTIEGLHLMDSIRSSAHGLRDKFRNAGIASPVRSCGRPHY